MLRVTTVTRRWVDSSVSSEVVSVFFLSMAEDVFLFVIVKEIVGACEFHDIKKLQSFFFKHFLLSSLILKLFHLQIADLITFTYLFSIFMTK